MLHQSRRTVPRHPMLGVESEQSEENRLTASLAGLAFALLLVVAGLFLFQHLQSKAKIEDCLLSGRRNCDQLVAPLS